MFAMYFFSATASPIPFYTLAALSQFFFCGFNTAIYAIVPDCVEYGEWKTGIRNDGFQYAFVSLGNKWAWPLEPLCWPVCWEIWGLWPMRHRMLRYSPPYTTPSPPFPAYCDRDCVVLFFYQINKNSYNRIIAELGAKKGEKPCSTL